MERYVKISPDEIVYFKGCSRWDECIRIPPGKNHQEGYFVPEDLYAEVYGYQGLDF